MAEAEAKRLLYLKLQKQLTALEREITEFAGGLESVAAVTDDAIRVTTLFGAMQVFFFFFFFFFFV